MNQQIRSDKYENSRGKKFNGYLSLERNATLPYMLVVPENLEEGKELIVESLNFEGTDIIEKIVPHVIRNLKSILNIFLEEEQINQFYK